MLATTVGTSQFKQAMYIYLCIRSIYISTIELVTFDNFSDPVMSLLRLGLAF